MKHLIEFMHHKVSLKLYLIVVITICLLLITGHQLGSSPVDEINKSVGVDNGQSEQTQVSLRRD